MNKRYHIEGNGERNIVFVHYFGGDAGSWQWLVKRLCKKHTCILLNLPGFDGTEPLDEPSIYGFANYINSCIAELELENYILCGHSMGAKLALYAAKISTGTKPDRIVLIAPSPATVEQMDTSAKERMLNHPDRGEAIKTVRGATVKKLRQRRFDYAVESQLRIDPATWDWWLEKGMNDNVADRIRGLDLGVTVIYSKEDPVIPQEDIHSEVLPYLKRPSTVTLGKTGHLIPMESPRKLARQFKRISKSGFAKSVSST